MKKVQTSLMAIAALAGVGGAFAFTAKHKTFNNTIYALRATTSPSISYQYFSTPPTDLGECDNTSLPKEACSFTSTATVNFFNNATNGYTTSFPVSESHSGSLPEIAVTPVEKVYIPF